MSAPKRYTEEVKAEAVRRYMAGESSPKVAADIGCTNTTIMSWVNKSFTTPETPKRSEDTMIEEKKEMTVKETTAAAGTATDVESIGYETGNKQSRYLYDNTEAAFCQAIISKIDECARDIFDNTDDNMIANNSINAYNAGKIQGLVYALTLLRGIKS